MKRRYEQNIGSVAAFAVLLLLCAETRAQTAAAGAGALTSGDKPSFHYANEGESSNLFAMNVGYQAAYDSNPLSNGATAQADEEQIVRADAALLRHTPGVEVSIEYHPYYQFFNHYSDYNRLDQRLSADLLLKMNRSWAARLRDDFLDRTGAGSPSSADSSPFGIGSPTALNQTIFTPLSNEQENSARVDLTDRHSSRVTFNYFGSYDLRSLSNKQIPLYDTRAKCAGGESVWQANEHARIGLAALMQQINVSSGQLPVGASKMKLASLIPTLAWTPRPNLELSVFAGPQLTKTEKPRGAVTGWGDPSGSQLRLAVGGMVADKSENASAEIAGQRMVTDGGGLLTYVTNSQVNAGLRRRIHANWDLKVGGGVSRNSWLVHGAAEERLSEETGAVGLVHSLQSSVVLEMEYEFARQSSNGEQIPSAPFARNRIAISVAWKLCSIPLGR